MLYEHKLCMIDFKLRIINKKNRILEKFSSQKTHKNFTKSTKLNPKSYDFSIKSFELVKFVSKKDEFDLITDWLCH